MKLKLFFNGYFFRCVPTSFLLALYPWVSASGSTVVFILAGYNQVNPVYRSCSFDCLGRTFGAVLCSEMKVVEKMHVL